MRSCGRPEVHTLLDVKYVYSNVSLEDSDMILESDLKFQYILPALLLSLVNHINLALVRLCFVIQAIHASLMTVKLKLITLMYVWVLK